MEIREDGKPDTQTHGGIPEAESNVIVQNGDPGVTNLDIVVNGSKFKVKLDDGEEVTLDVSEAMVAGDNNVFEITARGKPGGTATVIVGDDSILR